jgi:hypothetical protein
MTVIIRKPDLFRYNNADHVEFHKESLRINLKYEAVIASPDDIAAYVSAVEQEATIFKWIRKSDFTEKKAETDRKRDETYTGLLGVARINLKHFDPNVRDAAHHVYNLLENYGDLIHLGYDAETASIGSIISRLRSSDYLNAVQLLALDVWLNELARLNDLFKTYVEDSSQEKIDKPDVSPKAARRAADEILHRIIDRVTAQINLYSPETYAAYSEEFNTLVNHYNTLVHERYGRLHAKIDLSQADIAAIAPQPFTGKPVFVIPSVSLLPSGAEKPVELLFSEDFTVAYRNNLRPGTATLIIKGIGKYKGERITTFNIE